MVERRPGPVGIKQVVLVAVAVVGLVLGLAVATSLLPSDAQRIVFRTPLLIVILVGATTLVLIRLIRRPPER